MATNFSTVLSVATGGLISLSSVFISDWLKNRQDTKKQTINAKKQIFQILEIIERKCEGFLIEWQGMGDHLKFQDMPTFYLIDVKELGEAKFFIKSKSKNEYKKFLKIESELLKIKEKIISEFFGIDRGFINPNEVSSSLSDLSDEIYLELQKIIEDIRKSKEII